MGWLWTTTKLAVVGGAGYATCKADIWGDNETTAAFLNKQCQSCDTMKYYKAMIPSCEDMKISWADSWNSGVRAVFTFVDRLPQNTVRGATWTAEKVKELAATTGDSPTAEK